MIVPKSVAEKIDEVYRELAHVNEQDRHIWIQYEFLSWQWLLLVLLSIIPWLVWWKLRKKESTSRLLYGAFFVMWFSMLLDSFGTELGLWDYRYEILPFLPSFIPWDLSILPVFFMFLVQIKPRVSHKLKALIYSAVSAFIGEPIFEWLGLYQTLNWSVFYSFPIYYLKFLIGYFFAMNNRFEPLNTK